MAINQEEMLAVLVAYSATWQTLVGAANATEALEKLKKYQADDDGDNAVSYPRAVIVEIERERKTGSLGGRGALLISIEANPPDDKRDTVETQRTWFVDVVTAIAAEMRTVSYSRTTPDGYSVSHFQIKNITWSVPPFLVPEPEQEEQQTSEDTPQKPLWAVELRVEY